MIQKTTQRQLNAALGKPTTSNADGPEEWGQWIRNRYYSLEVAQHPLRARMCGFGDKDRRPLAPAAVAKMIVRREDNSIIDVDEIDVDFFLVTVDLWSADAKQDMNLVLLPSSSDRYVPAQISKPRKRGTSSSGPTPIAPLRPPRPTPYPLPPERSRPPTNHPPGSNSGITLRPIEPTVRSVDAKIDHFSQPPGTTPLLAPGSTTPYSTSGYSFPAALDGVSHAGDTTSLWSYPPPPDRGSFQAPTLPSIRSLGRRSLSPITLPTELTPATFPSNDVPDLAASFRDFFRGWNDVATGPLDSHPSVDPTVRDNASGSGSRWSNEPFALPSLPVVETWPATTPTPPLQQPLQSCGSTTIPHPNHQLPHHGHPIPSPPRHTYTRTLVGPLSANAQRLQDEHRKPGVFFLFQDLSIRTEGTFRLRMRLMNVGVLPAPNGLANSVHTGVSPVLAQIFTEPFTVYSAKRFPGVPDTTALSIAFGNQGQKLPLRNRHGASKQQRRPHRPGTASSEDESS